MSIIFSLFKKRNHYEIPYDDILAATNNFDTERNISNHVGLFHYNHVYRGELLRFGKVIVEKHEFMTKDKLLKSVSTVSRFKHKNIANFVGFCYENYESYIVTKFEVNGSLSQSLNITPALTSSSNSLEYVYKNLTCSERLKICLGVARALSYIHKQKIIHGFLNIKNILLDKDLEAKVVGFVTIPPDRLSKKRTQTVQKSDVYSFGVVLIDVFCQKYANFVHSQRPGEIPSISYEQFDNFISEQMHSEALTVLSETVNKCLNTLSEQHPDMDEIVKKLEEALFLQRKYGKESIKIRLDDIMSATKNFCDEKYLIGSGGYAKVYKAELEIFDATLFFGMEGNIQEEMCLKQCTVAIKRISHDVKDKGEQGFFLEIEMLRRCEHPNIVSLYGYCNENSELILVYELVPNGSLDAFLESKKTYLTWVQRINICLDIARGLSYLHTNTTGREGIIHRDIKSGNILLGKDWKAKIADFGLSKFYDSNQTRSTINTKHIAGTPVYLDPEYLETGRLTKKSDIYSFGVVLFEILSGTLAYDHTYNKDNAKGLPAMARKRFYEGTIMELVDIELMEEVEELCFGLKIGPNQESLKAFSKIAFQCIAEKQDARPTIENVINELEIALNLQEKRKDILKFSLEEINLGTENFSDNNFIRKEEYSKLYRGEVPYDNQRKTVVIKVTTEDNFLKELEILFGYKHENIIEVLGYCNENDKRIIVYEDAYLGSTLHSHVNDVNLTWIKRLEICMSIANGLNFLHNGFGRRLVVHKDIKIANIVLNGDLNAKICCFEFSLITPKSQEMESVFKEVVSPNNYKESDIYSFGVLLFEMLCGRLEFKEFNQLKKFLEDVIVFEGIKEQIEAKSLATFQEIAHQCLQKEREKRPKADELYTQLKKALDIQVLKDKLVVKKDLYSLKLEEGGNLGDHIVTFNHLVSELSNMDEIIKEEDLALFMLLSLPKSYNQFVDDMLTGITSLKLKDVLQKLDDNN